MLPAFALFTLAFGGVLVPRVNLIQDLVCRDYLSDKMYMDPNYHPGPVHFGENDPECNIPEISGRVTVFMLGDSVLGGLLAAIMSPYLGDLSDRYGRKGMMIFTSIGGLIKEVTGIFAATYPETFPLWWFYVGFIADGFCGSFIAGLAVSHAYAADCTPPAKRNVAFGYFQGMLFAGIGLGPLLAAYVIKLTHSFLTMFYVAFACHLIFIFNLLFVVPESLSKRRQEEAREKYRIEQLNKDVIDRTWLQSISHVSRNFFRPLKILWPTGEGSSQDVRRNLVLLVAIDTIMFGVAMGAMTILLVYSRRVFSWSNLEQSQMVSTINIFRVACLFIVLPLVTRLLRGPAKGRANTPQTGCDWVDLVIIRVAVFFDTLGFLGYTLAHTGPLFIFSGCIAALGGIGSPTLASSLTKHIPADKTGQLLGASAMLHALARVVAPLLFSSIYYATVGKYDQAVFLCLTVTFGCAWLLTFFLRAGVYLEDPAQPSYGVSESANDEPAVGRFGERRRTPEYRDE